MDSCCFLIYHLSLQQTPMPLQSYRERLVLIHFWELRGDKHCGEYLCSSTHLIYIAAWDCWPVQNIWWQVLVNTSNTSAVTFVNKRLKWHSWDNNILKQWHDINSTVNLWLPAPFTYWHDYTQRSHHQLKFHLGPWCSLLVVNALKLIPWSRSFNMDQSNIGCWSRDCVHHLIKAHRKHSPNLQLVYCCGVMEHKHKQYH